MMNTEEKIADVLHEHEEHGKYIEIEGVRTFYIEGVRTFYLDRGEGPVVFCVHGVPASSFIYRNVARHLDTLGFRTIAIDLPGLGLSDRPETFDYRFSCFTSFCGKLLDALSVEAFHLVVHDIGAPVGLALADNRSHAISSITVLNSMLDIANFTKPLPMRPFEKPVVGEMELASLTHVTWPIFMKAVGVESTNGIPKSELAAYMDLLKRADNGKAFLKIMRNFEQTEELSKTCYAAVKNRAYPVQLIWGENDPFLSWEKHGEPFLEARPDAQVHKVNSRHFVMEEYPEYIAQKIKELVSEIRSS